MNALYLSCTAQDSAVTINWLFNPATSKAVFSIGRAQLVVVADAWEIMKPAATNPDMNARILPPPTSNKRGELSRLYASDAIENRIPSAYLRAPWATLHHRPAATPQPQLTPPLEAYVLTSI
jgi:hypothetical protein